MNLKEDFNIKFKTIDNDNNKIINDNKILSSNILNFNENIISLINLIETDIRNNNYFIIDNNIFNNNCCRNDFNYLENLIKYTLQFLYKINSEKINLLKINKDLNCELKNLQNSYNDIKFNINNNNNLINNDKYKELYENKEGEFKVLEKRYNSLLTETELKQMQINSLEQLLNKKNLNNMSTMNNSNINKNINNNNNNINEIVSGNTPSRTMQTLNVENELSFEKYKILENENKNLINDNISLVNENKKLKEILNQNNNININNNNNNNI